MTDKCADLQNQLELAKQNMLTAETERAGKSSSNHREEHTQYAIAEQSYLAKKSEYDMCLAEEKLEGSSQE